MNKFSVSKIHDLRNYSEVISEFRVKHGCVAAGFPAVKSWEYQTQTQTQTSQHTVNASISCIGGVVELSTHIDDALGFEPESVWPVIAMLWDIHGYKGVYDLGVIGVWMTGIGAMLYVSSISDMEVAR